jgi:hypothetical protein
MLRAGRTQIRCRPDARLDRGKVIKARVLNKRTHEYKVEKLPEKDREARTIAGLRVCRHSVRATDFVARLVRELEHSIRRSRSSVF